MMFELVVIFVCILFNGVLACSEVAFIQTDKFVLRGLSDSGSKEGKLLLSLRKNPERVLSIIQVGITFVGAFAAAIGGAGAQETLYPWILKEFQLSENTAEFLSTLIVVIPLTYFSVVFGELIPKTIALKKPIYISTRLVYFLSILSYLFFPVIWVFEWSTKKAVRFFFKKAGKPKSPLFDLEDIVSEQGREYIINMVKIEKSTIRDALIKWQYVDYVTLEDSLENVEKSMIISGHTRLPVTKHGKVMGVINSREFFAYQKTGEKDWSSLVREPVILQEDNRLLKALKTLQKESVHMAIVNRGDELVGIITLEDIFEEIVGDIYDEDDYGSIKKILSKTRYIPK